MKANKCKGSGKPGAQFHYITVQVKKAAESCGEKIHKTFKIETQSAFTRHQNIMKLVYQGKYTGNDPHYRRQSAYYAKKIASETTPNTEVNQKNMFTNKIKAY